MRLLCQLCLLGAFVSLGFAAFACLMGCRTPHRRLLRSGEVASVVGFCLLTGGTLLLALALVTKDFRFAYVAQYSSRTLPWFYSLSALWVGQAGSLLLWCWLNGLLAILFRFMPTRTPSPLRGLTFGLLMLLSSFLVATTVFAVDPAAASLTSPREGSGLSPLLQHPAMLIHPPVIFLGYAAWSIPLALAIAALWIGRLDDDWTRAARSWTLFAWAVLGGGILLGAAWAYSELGWGGYWGWDPVENGSLLPWLTGTALIHALMVWQHAGLLKKTTVALAIATFGLCCFATFLTRSGMFSSLHAFSESPIGWLFLVLMIVLVGGGSLLIVARREPLARQGTFTCVLCRESMIAISMLILILITIIVCGGTLSTALSQALIGRHIAVGADFYNYVLIPTGLLLLTVTGTAPLLRWGSPPTRVQATMLRRSMLAALVVAMFCYVMGTRDPLSVAVVGLAAFAVTAFATAILIEARRRAAPQRWRGVYQSLRMSRRKYAGFLAHLGLFCLALGITYSARGSQQLELQMKVGETVNWEEYTVHLAEVTERQDVDKLVAQAHLNIADGNGLSFALRPAQHYHLLQREWTSEVAVDSTWARDFYTILHAGHSAADPHAIQLTLRINPMMRWLWTGGVVMVCAALVALVPARAAGRSGLAPHPVSSARCKPEPRTRARRPQVTSPRRPRPAPHSAGRKHAT